MKNFLIAFAVFLVWSIFGMWYYTCIVKEICNDGNNQVAQEKIENQNVESNSNDFDTDLKISDSAEKQITDLEEIDFSFPENLGITENLDRVSFPEGSTDFKKLIFEFLNNNQNKELIITGLMNANEGSNDSNLGQKRANSVKDLLVEFGVNPDRISVENKMHDFSFNSNGGYSGGIQFRFENISSEKLKTIESRIANKTLYSGFGSKEFIADNTLQAYALELKNYLSKYPTKNAEITGHTDSTGDWEANEWYGMERAKNVKSFLVYQGIDSNRLKASSKGEQVPVASNATIEGRRKNRRIEIKVE